MNSHVLPYSLINPLQIHQAVRPCLRQTKEQKEQRKSREASELLSLRTQLSRLLPERVSIFREAELTRFVGLYLLDSNSADVRIHAQVLFTWGDAIVLILTVFSEICAWSMVLRFTYATSFSIPCSNCQVGKCCFLW